MDPPASVDARRVSAPSAARDRRVLVVGSKATVAFENTSRPAKAPARPTVPMRSKSTRGRAARTALRENSRAGIRENIEGGIWLACTGNVCHGGLDPLCAGST